MLALGTALGVALTAVGVLVWIGVSAWATYEARAVLRAEAAVVEAAIAEPGGLDADRYEWDEPHHRFAAERIDPYFLQVFDAEGSLLRASDNVALLAAGYPAHLLPSTQGDGALTPLAVFRHDGQRLYRITEPLYDPDGTRVGNIQLARFDPGITARLGRLAGGLGLGLGLLLAGLLGLLWSVGGRVVRPLEAITQHAESLSATTLGDRLPVPADADLETATLARTLNASLERLDESFAEMKRFTANAAHELQTPLTVLQGHVDVALRREREPEAYRETLRLLRAEAEALTRTVRGLLALARLDASAEPLPDERVDLAGLIRAEAGAARARADAKGLDLRVEAPASVVARGHTDLLREAVRTLLDNALKYIEAGHVTLEAGTREGEAWVAVEDSGPGLAPEHRAHATDRFWRAPDVQHLPGSGLGLALADRVARTHGGTLTFADAEPHGLRATLTLPAAP